LLQQTCAIIKVNDLANLLYVSISGKTFNYHSRGQTSKTKQRNFIIFLSRSVMKVHRCFRSIIFIDKRHIYILLSILHKKYQHSVLCMSSFGLYHRPDPSRHALDDVSAQLCGHVENPG